ncbi:MAG: hypothetical protein AAF687_14570 [Pseudomonadota bacterium]
MSTLVPGAILSGIIGSVLAFPFALPIILWSERTRRLTFWWFATAGLVIGALVLAFIAIVTNARSGAAQEFLILGSHILPSTTAAAVAYWFVAWRMDPPIESQ